MFLGMLPALGALLGLKPKPSLAAYTVEIETGPAWEVIRPPLKFHPAAFVFECPPVGSEEWFRYWAAMQAETIALAPRCPWIGNRVDLEWISLEEFGRRYPGQAPKEVFGLVEVVRDDWAANHPGSRYPGYGAES